MADDGAEGTGERRDGERAHTGENLRRAYQVKRDGTFASFLLLLEDMEPLPVGQSLSK
jgi:hypothetical protein